VKGEKVHVDGWIDGYGQPRNRLYVNRGIGFSKAPIRINCRPELTISTLRSKIFNDPSASIARRFPSATR
jgi:hypothetical protein